MKCSKCHGQMVAACVPCQCTKSSMTNFERVEEFHKVNKVQTYDILELSPEEYTTVTKLRDDLIDEEFTELLEAIARRDVVEIADALGDMLYVIYGTAHQFRIPIDAVVAEIHKSNMSKLGPDGQPVLRADGKILKGPNYFPPDIKRVLGETNAS